MTPTITLTNRLELSFPGVPIPFVRALLKDAGFTWDARARVWHLAYPRDLIFVRGEPVIQDGIKKACALFVTLQWNTAAQAAELERKIKAEQIRRAESSMEDACGING